MIKKIKKVGLCGARHNFPEAVTDSIFPTTVDPIAVNDLEKIAFEEIHKIVKMHDIHEVHLYVTGLSVALLAVINAWHMYKKCFPDNYARLIAYHYNREDNSYYAQAII